MRGGGGRVRERAKHARDVPQSRMPCTTLGQQSCGLTLEVHYPIAAFVIAQYLAQVIVAVDAYTETCVPLHHARDIIQAGEQLSPPPEHRVGSGCRRPL